MIIRTLDDPYFHADFNKRTMETKELNSRRRVTSFAVGMKIDFRSTEYVWCEAVVKRIIFRGRNNHKHIIVSFEV